MLPAVEAALRDVPALGSTTAAARIVMTPEQADAWATRHATEGNARLASLVRQAPTAWNPPTPWPPAEGTGAEEPERGSAARQTATLHRLNPVGRAA